MHPRNSTSRCSHREQRRLPPCKRRHTRAISLRRVDSSQADAQGPPPGFAAAPRAPPPAPRPGAAVGHPRTPGPSFHTGGIMAVFARGTRGRPGRHPRGRSGVAGAGPGGREQPSAGRASAAPYASWWSHRLGSGRGVGGQLCARPRAGGRDFDEGRASDRAARLRRTIGARCRRSQTRSRTPGCDPRGSRGSMVCQGPNRGGHPRPLPPGAATDKREVSTGRLERRTGPRGTGRGGSIRSYGACVSSIHPGCQNHAHEW